MNNTRTACPRQADPKSSSARRNDIEVSFSANGKSNFASGKLARTLLALESAGKHGVTALEVSNWAFRLAAYCHSLRNRYELNIETVMEPHHGGRHARYILRSPIAIHGAKTVEGRP